MVRISGNALVKSGLQPRLIYITGCDGTGKTTQARLMEQKLKESGISVRRVWLRFPFFFSLPLLAYARLRGLSWYERTEGVLHGYWDFRQSSLLQTLLPWLILFDAAAAGLLKIGLPLWRGKTIICERYVLDMLADLSVAFGGQAVETTLPGRLLIRLLPANTRVVILDLDKAAIQQRRGDLQSDRFLQARLDVYRRLAKTLSLQSFSSTVNIETVHNQIISVVLA